MEDANNAKQVELYLKSERKIFEKLQREPKMLLLGSSDSGKSTLLKQLKILNGGGFSENEISVSRTRITAAIFNIVNTVLAQMTSFENIHIEKQYNTFLEDCETWQQGNATVISKEDILSVFKKFWEEPPVKALWQANSGNNAMFPDTSEYFISAIDRIFAPIFIPTEQDILNLRTVTQNCSDTVFDLPMPDGSIGKLHVIDVSGLSHHRGRWVSYFDDVKCVIFVASLACYDLTMAEEADVNRMVDSLVLFEDMVNHPLLEKKDFVLLLNKKDLYEKKIMTKNIIDYFPNYKGKPQSSSNGMRYFDNKFRDKNKINNKVITSHVTQCNSTEVMKVVVHAILQSIRSELAVKAGL